MEQHLETPLKKSVASGITEVCALLLAFLFAYTGIVKLYDWQETRLAMYNQVIPDWSQELLLYGIPVMELLLAVLLLVPRFRRMGFVISVILMGSFTAYVAWVWLGLAGRTPCSCGGIISSLTWGQHLIFNLVFLGISIVGVWMERKERMLDDR
ncbi:MauE/DoxX family redox-associated membrane protein [Algoriphagus terrigena]|uniref:MauE/DoxX family redox-associated membrane protein n=1 Tax=Algoriphagus terrigena TaxID=344884 RepID=UPI0003FA5D1A|nr:MauE/DoxX family redox-associated membrane protein [Algoriphagus terrigena]